MLHAADQHLARSLARSALAYAYSAAFIISLPAADRSPHELTQHPFGS